MGEKWPLSKIPFIPKTQTKHTDKCSPVIAHSYSISNTLLFINYGAYIQDFVWVDSTVTLVHMNIPK
jgi:hypothetical protein